MTGTVTFTGKLGPGKSVTALVFSNTRDVLFDIANGVAIVTYGDGGKVQSLQLSDVSGITVTVVEGVSLGFAVTNA